MIIIPLHPWQKHCDTATMSRTKKISCRQFLFVLMKTIKKIVCNFWTVFVDSDEKIVSNFERFPSAALHTVMKVFCL